ncbi:leucine-rich PPR motif-containing protein, mitochondrial [Trichonephila clavata]|uniref:Leucine-rich PPR motif-containing protein, mitochondrial n=1 Tax=Trichonephila clavata TaxID=2740835 RepID=A0A8X6IHC1_TRICU|nr:leucine-rich PPR motif-containing protein, mitochondrial [Trichonephila clavata]
MSTIIRKTTSMRNIRRIRILLRTMSNHTTPHFSFLESFVMNSVLPRQECFATVARVHNHNALKDNTELENPNGVNSTHVDNILKELDFSIKRRGRCVKNSIENVLSMVETIGFVSETQGLYLLRCCGFLCGEKPDERAKIVDEVWSKLTKLGMQMDVKHFNSYLKVLVDAKRVFSTSQFVASMENANIAPNKVTYMLLIQKYCDDGNLSGASEILHCLKEKGFPLNENVFNLLIKGHIKANDISGAKDILEVMRSSDLFPSAESYAALACGYAEKNNIHGVKSVLEEAKNCHISFSNKNYLQILAALSTENTEFVDELIGTMEDIHAWRQEVINAIMDLVLKGMDSSAFKLLLTIAHSENNSANIFVKHLIKCDAPIEMIVNYCEEITSRGLQDNVPFFLKNAIKAAAELKKIDLAFGLFEMLQKKGIPVRTYDFHLLFSCHKNIEEGIWLILTKMFKLGVPPDFFTYLDYVFPAVSISNPELVISKIQETGHSSTSAIDPLFQYYCFEKQFDNALFLVEKYPVSIHPSFSLKKFVSMSLSDRKEKEKAHNTQHTYKVLNFVLQNCKLTDDNPEVSYGKNLAFLIQSNPSLFEALHNALKEKFKCSKLSIDICSNILRTKKPELLAYVKRLKTSENYSMNKKPESLSVAEEQKELKLLKEKGLPTHHYLLECLSNHLKERKNVLRINELKNDLDKEGIEYPPTLCAQLLLFYCETSNLVMAKRFYEFLKESAPSFKLDTVKVIDYAALLIKFSRFEEALDIIKNECQELLCFGTPELLLRSIKKLFSLAVETGNMDFVVKLQGFLLHHANKFNSTAFYEPLVNITYTEMILKVPLKNLRNVHANLEKVIKISSSLSGWGKQVALCELTLAFLETGRNSEALKVMQNLRNKHDSGHLEGLCFQLYDQNRMKELLMFLKIICAAEHLDREKLVNNLVKLTDDRNDWKAALALYNCTRRLFELSDNTKHLLSCLLSRNKQKIPFSIPQHSVSLSDEVTPVIEKNEVDERATAVISEFLHSVKEEDAQQALEKLQNLKKGFIRSLTLDDMTEFVRLLIERKLLNELSYNVPAMSFIIENANEIFKPLLDKYSNSCDFESLIQIGNLLPDFSLKKCSYNNFLSRAYILSEKHEDLLIELEKRWDKKNKLFSFQAFEELVRRADLEERVTNLAKKYLEQNFDLPIAIVWAHYLTNENYEKANELYKLHSIAADKVNMLVLKAVRKQENITLGKAYIAAINNLNARKRCQEKAYGTLLDIMVLKGMYDEATALIAEAQGKDINLEKHYRSTLIMLKSSLEREKKKVPFTISSEELAISG